VSEDQTGTEEEQEPPEELDRRTCYRCGAELAEGADRCPQCGRRQTRLCYCGHAIAVTAPECPHCHADWSAALRVRHKSRGHNWNPRALAVYTAAGALATIALAALANSTIGGLALHSLPPGRTGLPAPFAARLSLALTTLGRNVSHIVAKIAYLGGGPWVILAVAGTGALLGALIYLRHTGSLRLRWPLRSKRVARRRRRGVY